MSSNTNDDDDVVNRLVNATHINENVEFDETKKPNLRDELFVYWNNVMEETANAKSESNNTTTIPRVMMDGFKGYMNNTMKVDGIITRQFT